MSRSQSPVARLAQQFRRLRRRVRGVRRHAGRPFQFALGVFVFLILLTAGFVGVRAVLVARQLEHARRDVIALRADLLSAAPAGAIAVEVAKLQRDAGAGRATAGGPLWGAWQHAPFIGSSLITARGMADATDRLSRQVLPTLLAEVRALPGLRAADGRVNVALLARQAGPLAIAAARLDEITAAVRRLPSTMVGPLNTARLDLTTELEHLRTGVRGAAVAAEVAPGMLGVSGARHYLLVVQNNAEARATGGIIGAYGLITVDAGRLHLDSVGSDTELVPSPTPVASFGESFDDRYGPLGEAMDWREVTLTPDFPTAALVMTKLWRYSHPGDNLDGVVSIDPVGLAQILAALGPVQTGTGVTLTSANAVSYLLSQAYQVFPTKAGRSTVLTGAERVIFDRLSDHGGANAALATRLGAAVSTRHLQLWSARSEEEAALRQTTIAGALPVNADPYLMVVTQDVGGDKLSYYLRRSISYVGRLSPVLIDEGAGPRPQEVGSLTIHLSNTAPASGLPGYVTARQDLPGGVAIPVGQSNTYVSVYVARGGRLDAAELDGRPLAMASQTEQGLAIFSTALTLDPGQARTLVLQVEQPTTVGAGLVYQQQPLVVPDVVTIDERADGRRLVPTYR